MIACASIGHDPSRAPSPEWIGAATAEDRPALFILDRARSWATAPGLAEVLTQALTSLRTRQDIRRILAIGTSLGAVTALAATHILAVDALIAIGPQHQPAAPWENRWKSWTATLPATLTVPVSQARQTYILHAKDDHPQAMGFTPSQIPPRSGTADHLFFPGQSHDTLARHLKPAMPGLLAAALNQDRRRALRLLSQAGGKRFSAAKSALP